ncbi:hypothetical protein H5410_001523, partial [Solanum commersonii]
MDLDTGLVLFILLNKCVVVGYEVIPELHLIMSKIINEREHDCNWLISVSMERFGERQATASKEEWSKKGIATLVSHMCRLLLVNMTKVPYVASTSASISLSEIYRCITLLDISHITKHPCHVPKLIKNYATMSRLLQDANQIMILSLHGFACSSQ